MTVTFAAQDPSLHGLTGRQPVGQTQIAAIAEYAGSTTLLRRAGHDYWVVRTMDARDAFRVTWAGVSAVICIREDSGRYVVEYHSVPWWALDAPARVEVDRCRTLKAAIGMAVAESAHCWRRATA